MKKGFFLFCMLLVFTTGQAFAQDDNVRRPVKKFMILGGMSSNFGSTEMPANEFFNSLPGSGVSPAVEVRFGNDLFRYGVEYIHNQGFKQAKDINAVDSAGPVYSYTSYGKANTRYLLGNVYVYPFRSVGRIRPWINAGIGLTQATNITKGISNWSVPLDRYLESLTLRLLTDSFNASNPLEASLSTKGMTFQVMSGIDLMTGNDKLKSISIGFGYRQGKVGKIMFGF